LASWEQSEKSEQDSKQRLDSFSQICNISYMPAERPITEALLRAIAGSGMSFKALERETGVKRQSLMKFVRGEQSLRGDLMDKLAVFFRLELRPRRKGR
jgi:hypothetical protein